MRRAPIRANRRPEWRLALCRAHRRRKDRSVSASTTARRGARCRPTRSLARKGRSGSRRFRCRGSRKPFFISRATTSCFSPNRDSSASSAPISCPGLPSSSLPSAVVLGAEPCRPQALIARGLTPVDQTGFFASDPAKIDPRRPDVPVVFLRLGDVRAFAQIDTGYEDLAYGRSVDINQALFERLVQSGIKLDRAGDSDVWTCDGHERWPRYQVKDRALMIENGQWNADRADRRLPSDRETGQQLRRDRGNGRARGAARAPRFCASLARSCSIRKTRPCGWTAPPRKSPGGAADPAKVK